MSSKGEQNTDRTIINFFHKDGSGIPGQNKKKRNAILFLEDNRGANSLQKLK